MVGDSVHVSQCVYLPESVHLTVCVRVCVCEGCRHREMR